MQFKGNYLIRGKILCCTGLHIGGVADAIKIGGTDAPVIMDRMTSLPYIPGSSLKGKMRSLLEQRHGDKWLTEKGNPHNCKDPGCDLCITFGRGAEDNIMAGPTRLIVRDAYPDEGTIGNWNDKEDIMHGTEVKGENFLNRISSAATPRFLERVPAGSLFNFEMVFSVYAPDDLKRLALVFEAMSMVEDNYLGASGTRGYGKIAFSDVELLEKTKDDYTSGEDWKPYQKTADATTAREIMAALK
ncbi:MAG TPA: type III-A CRISPR-associated RAMP protein Csm3 [Methanoculleus sp.]|nr:type III-A CRISPR-associated RAMP protein Csm3 [Methanoculleus sp.]